MHVPNLRTCAFVFAAASVSLTMSSPAHADGMSDPNKAAALCTGDAYKARTDAEIQRCCDNMVGLSGKQKLKQCVAEATKLVGGKKEKPKQ
jgi:hypothetical protein